MIAFAIHEREAGNDGTVLGRCYKGPLRVGSLFTLVDDDSGTTSGIRLQIVRIETYRRSLDEIDDGLTARLQLEGEGIGLLPPRGLLRG